MERLTKRVGCGEAVTVAEGDICAPFIKAGLCKTGSQGFPYSRWERHCNDTCVLGMIIDKLAAYEDTGCSPEEFDRMCREMSAVRTALGIETYEKLRDIVQDGRLLVLPFKIGDTVWYVRDCGDWVDLCQKNCEICSTDCSSYRTEYRADWTAVEYEVENLKEALVVLFGYKKDFFATHEEAEAAIAERKGGQ